MGECVCPCVFYQAEDRPGSADAGSARVVSGARPESGAGDGTSWLRLNDKPQGFHQMMERIASGQVARVVIGSQDRFVRLG
jgi:hypothetical protein